VAFWITKAAISLKCVKINEKLLWRAYRNSPALFRTVQSRPPMASPALRLGVCNLPLLSQEQVKLRISNLAGTFTGPIQIKAHLKFCRKGSVGVSMDCPNFGIPLLYQERVKLRTSNFVGTFIGSIGTKAHEKCWE